MKVQSVVSTTPPVKLNSLVNSNLSREKKGMLLLSLHLLKLFEKYQVEKCSLLDFRHRKLFDVCLNDGEIKRMSPGTLKLAYDNTSIVVLMGSFLISAEVNCLTKRVDFHKFKVMVATTDKIIDENFLDRHLYPYIYTGVVHRCFKDSAFFRSLYDLNGNGVLLKYPPKGILVDDNLVIGPSMYSLG